MHARPVPAELNESWQETLVHWTHKASHDTLLGRAAKHQQLAWLAARYREAARSNPRDPIARDRLKAVQRAAALLVFSAPVVRETRRRSRGGPALLLCAAMSVGLCFWLTNFMRTQHHPQGAPPAQVSHQP